MIGQSILGVKYVCHCEEGIGHCQMNYSTDFTLSHSVFIFDFFIVSTTVH